MSEPCVAIAQAIVATINGASLSRPLSASLIYSLDANLIATSDPAATVMLLGSETTYETRSREREVCTIGVAIHCVVPDRSASTVEGLLLLVREVRDLFRAAVLAGGVVVRQRTDRPYDYEALRQRRQFLSLIELDVQFSRAFA